MSEIREWSAQSGRTTYFFDVRSEAEYAIGHLSGFASVPGGQLLQETEMRAPVRGARIVLVDDDGVRANMTASWLSQMAWEVFVVEGYKETDVVTEPELVRLPPTPKAKIVDAQTLSQWLEQPDVVVVDFSRYGSFRKAHIPGAWFMIRSEIAESVPKLPQAAHYVLTAQYATMAYFAAPEFEDMVDGEVFVLEGGNAAWTAAGKSLEAGETRLASEPIDEYRRPYVGTDVPEAAMQAYLDWEFGLVAQLERDGTHHFKPLEPHVGVEGKAE